MGQTGLLDDVLVMTAGEMGRTPRFENRGSQDGRDHWSYCFPCLLAGAGIQVGAFSTTLFEGMALGTKTVVIEMPGSEYMRPAIERGDVLFVRDVEELIAKIDAAPLAADPDYYYAEPAKPLV